MSERIWPLTVDQVSVANRVDRVTAKFSPGAITAICGPNGAGKSTLLSCLAGLIAPDGGAVGLGGAPLFDMPLAERARLVGYLPQSPEVAWDVTVEILVGLGRLPWRGAPALEAQSAIDDAIAAMDLEEFRDRPISRLSGGERARALMARVLATRPTWVLADEPLASLDLSHAATLMRCFRQQAGSGRGVALVLHDLATAMNHADRVLVLDRGRLAADGPPAQALSQSVISRVWGVDARWLGEPGMQALAVS